MRIGIDFDNTIVNTSVTSKRYLDKHLPGNNLNSYHDLSKNEGLDFFYKYYFQTSFAILLIFYH